LSSINGLVRRVFSSAAGVKEVSKGDHLVEIHTIGIDLGKNNLSFSRHGRMRRSRRAKEVFSPAITPIYGEPASLRDRYGSMRRVALLGRALREQGHDVRLRPAQYIKPHVKTNKNDFIDAEAVAEAVGRLRMRFIPIQTDDQLDMPSFASRTGTLDSAENGRG
jgi:transposase